MLATKEWVMWVNDKSRNKTLHISEKRDWNEYAKVYLRSGEPTHYRLVAESDDIKELKRFVRLTKED